MAASSASTSAVPPSFVCPLTLEIMRDPATAADGHSYERKDIEKWLRTSDLSPLTGEPLPHKQLTRSHALRNAIEEFQAGQRDRAKEEQRRQARMPAAHSGVKVILLGDSNVGKTSLLHRVKEGSFSESAQPTIGCSFCMHTVPHGGQNVGLAIWDTAGQEKYRSFTRQYFRGASAAALVYDTTCGPSLDGARRWLRDVRTELDDIAVVLVGSKSDLTAQREVDPAQAASIAAAEGAAHMECSAKDGTNVDAVFEKVVELLMARGLTNSDRALSAPFGGGTVVAQQQKRGAVTEVGCCQQ